MQAIRRGTTPPIHFTTDIEEADIEVMYISFEQSGEIKIEKTKQNAVWDETGFTITLSQAETLLLSEGFCDVQIRARLITTQAPATSIFTLLVEDVLKEGVI